MKDRFQPSFCDDAAMLLERHYEKVRSAQSNVIPVTVRFLESLIRLSQAHARLMYRGTVTLEDAVAIIRLMECSAFAYGGFNGDVDNIEDFLYCDPLSFDGANGRADDEFLVFEHKILRRYGMVDLLSDTQSKRASSLLDADMDIDENYAHSAAAWQEMEDPRDRRSSVALDQYGRSYFSPNTQEHTNNKRRR